MERNEGARTPRLSASKFRSGLSGFVLGDVLAQHALVTLQCPRLVRPLREPIGNTDLTIDLTGSHGDARLLARGDDFLHTKLAVAENGDKSDKHCDLRRMRIPGRVQFMQGSCHSRRPGLALARLSSGKQGLRIT